MTTTDTAPTTEPQPVGNAVETPLPCPFCGQAPERHAYDDTHMHLVECTKANCRIQPYSIGDTEAEALAAWNTRA